MRVFSVVCEQGEMGDWGRCGGGVLGRETERRRKEATKG